MGTSRSRMQQPIAACTRAQTLTKPCPCATCICLLHPAPTSAQDGLDSLQLALAVFFCHHLAQSPHLHLQWARTATCAGSVYLAPTSAFTDVHTTCNHAATTPYNLHWWCLPSTNQAFTSVPTCIEMSVFCYLHCVVVVVYIYILYMWW